MQRSAPIERLIAARIKHARIRVVIRNLRFSQAALTTALVLSLASFAGANASSSPSAAEAGAILFRDQGCAHCHGAGGVGGKKGPDLTRLPGDRSWPPAKITSQILNGGQKMPPFGDALTDEQIAQLVAYLRAKHRPVPPPEQPEQPPAPPPH